MKKRLMALVTAMVLLFTVTVFSDYYPDDLYRADIPFSEMLEYKLDFEEVVKQLKETERLIDSHAPIGQILRSFDSALPVDSIDFSTRCTLDNIVASVDNSPENSARLTESENYAVDIQQISMEIIKKLYNSEHKEAFLKYMEATDEEMREFVDQMPTDEEYAIIKELNGLSEKYYNSVFGSYEMGYNGKKYTLETIDQIPENELPKQYLRYIDESADVLSDIFIDIVEKRIEYSRAAGYEKYIDYAYGEEYPKDYTDEDRKKFYEYTAEYIVPLYRELYETLSVLKSDDMAYDIDLSEEEILSIVRENMADIHPELVKAYDYMLEYDLYDIGAGDNKRPGGYTTTLEYFGVPFIFANPEGSQNEMLTTLIHEYGHFNADFHEVNRALVVEPLNLDIAEIQSQGLELMSLEDYGRYYGNDASYHRAEQLIYMMDSVISASLYSMWLEDVYETAETGKLTRKIVCDKYKTACEKLGIDDFYLATGLNVEWMTVPHNFDVPFYYISYGVSALASLELFSEFVSDRNGAIDRYMRISAKGTYVPFVSTLKECGFSSVFEESTFSHAADTIRRYLGLGYTDVDEEDWFYPYIVNSAYFIDGVTETTFEPNTPATRLSFVEALGRMEEDINGIGTPSYDFADTDSVYVSWAADEDVVAGISETEFGADMPVTREQVVCFLYRFAGEPEVEGAPEFSDSKDISSWATDAIAWAQKEGIVSGYTDDTFRPKNTVTRGEVAKLITDTYKTNY